MGSLSIFILVLVGLLVTATATTGVSDSLKVRISNATIVRTKDKKRTILRTEYPKEVKPLEVDNNSKLSVAVSLVDEHGSSVWLQQVFLRWIIPETSQECFFVMKFEEGEGYIVSVDIKKEAHALMLVRGNYDIELIIGDSRIPKESAIKTWKMTSIHLLVDRAPSQKETNIHTSAMKSEGSFILEFSTAEWITCALVLSPAYLSLVLMVLQPKRTQMYVPAGMNLAAIAMVALYPELPATCIFMSIALIFSVGAISKGLSD